MNTRLPSTPLRRLRGIAVGVHWSTLGAVITSVVAASLLPQAAPGHPALVYCSTTVLAALARGWFSGHLATSALPSA